MFHPTEEQVRDTCGLGKGPKCCRYLAMERGGMACAKSDCEMRKAIDDRFAQGMNAQGDNCPGPFAVRFTENVRDDFGPGDIAFEYHGCTYGCLHSTETPVCAESGCYPFIGVPRGSFEKVPFGTLKAQEAPDGD